MLKITEKKAARWRGRFLAVGIAGLERDAARPGRPATIVAATVRRVVRMTTQQKPPHAHALVDTNDGAGRGHLCGQRAPHPGQPRTEAAPGQKLRSATIRHSPRSWKTSSACTSTRPSMLWCCWLTRKARFRHLDRTQPGLPMKKGRGQTMTHDYKRNGTTTLFAALNTATGEVYGLCQQRHRDQDWLKLLRLISQTVAAEKQIHIICDNYATHKHPTVLLWLSKHKRFPVHFTPSSASWHDRTFFLDLTEKRIRRGVFRDLEQLVMAIGDYIDRHNENPRPFIWTATASDVLAKVSRARRALNNGHSA